MKRTLIALAVAAMLTGCSGLQTRWRFQVDMNYATPEDAPAPAAAVDPKKAA